MRLYVNSYKVTLLIGLFCVGSSGESGKLDFTPPRAAGLAIRHKTQVNRIEQIKEIIRAWGANPEEILSKEALLRGNITETYD